MQSKTIIEGIAKWTCMKELKNKPKLEAAQLNYVVIISTGKKKHEN